MLLIQTALLLSANFITGSSKQINTPESHRKLDVQTSQIHRNLTKSPRFSNVRLLRELDYEMILTKIRRKLIISDSRGPRTSGVQRYSFPVIRLINSDKYRGKRLVKVFDRIKGKLSRSRTWADKIRTRKKKSSKKLNEHSRVLMPSPYVTKLLDTGEQLFDADKRHLRPRF